MRDVSTILALLCLIMANLLPDLPLGRASIRSLISIGLAFAAMGFFLLWHVSAPIGKTPAAMIEISLAFFWVGLLVLRYYRLPAHDPASPDSAHTAGDSSRG
jgi:hypothetical protein